MSQLSMFDYINGITIGSIAAEMATALEDDFKKPLTAMVVYALLSVAFSIATSKSIKLRRFLTGETLILYDDGKIFEKNLKKAKLDVSEFLSQCRTNGYFNIANIQTAILEPNGKISFLPLSSQRPVTPCDLNLSPAQEKAVVNVIIDGKILPDNLKFTGNNEQWLQKQLQAQEVSKVEDVFLATCDRDNNLSVYVKIKKKMTRDMFE
ncbi:DUF421 domain-containing protein [Hydrogenoanaerobacterium sp.]|uniref:DUF421 domain-containing protein n=1 Tax=Hydrogenoanaerobacterium sp. TaxID=2953763 RepID=UPI0028A22D80|nr:DUF421 domain-containing protein [Hydrogenoanaerobacterium sp.]